MATTKGTSAEAAAEWLRVQSWLAATPASMEGMLRDAHIDAIVQIEEEMGVLDNEDGDDIEHEGGRVWGDLTDDEQRVIAKRLAGQE